MSQIHDSGNRREFESGAVRDIAEGKGRCDLLPLDIIASIFTEYRDKNIGNIIQLINDFIRTGNRSKIELAVVLFSQEIRKISVPLMFMEVSKHFEDGAKKYDERNWEKGIPTHCYVDSGVRHFLKYIDGFEDEHNDRAFVWNMLCLLWTCVNKPELDDLPYKYSENNTKDNSIITTTFPFTSASSVCFNSKSKFGFKLASCSLDRFSFDSCKFL